MKNLASICIRRPVFAAMIVLTLVVIGGASFLRLGVDRLPKVDLPQVNVRTLLPGAAVEEVETQISEPLEEAINTVEGITEIRSTSGPGISQVQTVFTLDRDIEAAAQDVRDRVAAVLGRLPQDTEPPVVAKFNNDSSPVLTLSLAGNLSIRELTEIADKIAKPRLERSSGVGDVQIIGGLERAINIAVSAERLAAYRLSIVDVQNALARQNADVPGGNVTSGTREQVLRTLGKVTDPEAFNDLVVKTVNGAPIRIRDIGMAEDGTKEQRSAARLDGVPTVVLEVRKQSDANSVAVINAVKANLVSVQSELPAGVSIQVARDQSRYINEALSEINLHLILGSILASLVVFAFMRNLRATLIAAVAIPCSVISAFGMMAALDFTLNSVTMLALVLMVGIVIDDAIVVLENIFRWVEEKHLPPFEAARQATAEIALPVMATTACLVVIFIPVSFMSSISGRFLYQFGLTAAVAIVVSLIVSFTLTPMMSARLFQHEAAHGGHAHAASRQGFYRRVDSVYGRALGWGLAHPRAIALIAVLVIASGYPLYRLVQQEFFVGNVDEGEFEIGINAPEGTSMGAMDELVRAVDADLRQVRGVKTVLVTTGGGFLSAVNFAQAYVRLVPHEERVFSITRLLKDTARLRPWKAFQGNFTQRDVMQDVRRRMRKYAPVQLNVRNIQAFSIGGGNAELEFAIRGPELGTLVKYADTLRERAEGIVDANISLQLDKPELRAQIDHDRAADLGVRTQDIASALRLMVGGDEEVSRFRDPQANEDYDVQLRLSEADRSDASMIERLYVPRTNGDLVRLDSVVRLVEGQSPSRVDRLDRQRQVALRAGVAPGFALADRLDALRDDAAKLQMAPGYTSEARGRGRELERTFVEFGWAFLLSIIFMYMVLASQYESLLHPAIILLSLPLSLPFAMLTLWATGNTLNLYSALGMLVLFGVVAKNAILQVDCARNLLTQGLDLHAAVTRASHDRLRPILMTTLALVGGMLPLVLGTGPGAEERRAVAVVVIGGQSLSLFLTLLITPVAFAILEDARARLRAGSPKTAAAVNV
jgi:hydrophobic/amphiphilic exporter-1 (mainly G- bacteria), HAE1 family